MKFTDAMEQPTIFGFSEGIQNPLFDQFCQKMEEKKAKVEFNFSKCSWEYGWNVRFKKKGKTLCTIYPRNGYFTVMVVIGNKEKECFELSSYSKVIQNIYLETKEGNGQRWLMIDLEDEGIVYEDVWKLVDLRG